MATRKFRYLVKRSNVVGKKPISTDLLLGELALNTADVKLYASGTTSNSILPIGWDRIARTGDTMTGILNMGGNNIISAGTINGVTIQTHATRHQHGGADEIATATPAANAIPKATSGGKLDGWVSDASTTVKGLVKLNTAPTGATNPIAVGVNSIGYQKAITGVTYVNGTTVLTTKTVDNTTTNITLRPNIITAGTVGSSSAIPVITYNARGEITSTTTAGISFSNVYNQAGTQINGARVIIANVTSNASSVFTFTFPVTVTTIHAVSANAIFNSAAISDQPIATLNTVTTTAVSGRVVESNLSSILIGGSVEGLEYAGAGISVSIIVVYS